MQDLREELLGRIMNGLYSAEVCADMPQIRDILIRCIGDYEISERCTALTVVDDNDTRLLKLFAGTLLTEGKSKTTIKDYTGLLIRFRDDIGKSLTEVTTMDIRMWIAQKQPKISISSCETYRAYLSAFYTWLLEEEYIAKSPMAKVKPIKTPRQIKYPFSSVEIDKIRCSFSPKQVKQRAIFEFLLASGVRANELCNIRVSDIDFAAKSVTVREAKGGDQRVTFINDLAITYVRQYLENRKYSSEYVFCKRGEAGDQMNTGNVEDIFRNIGRRAHVQNTHPHRCRRTFATELHRKGMSIRNIQQLMGHKDVNTTTRYVSLSNEQNRVEYEKYS